MKEDLTDFLFQTGEEFRWGLLFIYPSLVWSVAIGKGIKADHFFFISSDGASWSSASKLSEMAFLTNPVVGSILG